MKGKKVLAQLRVPQPPLLSTMDSGVGKDARGKQLKGNAGERLEFGMIGDGEAIHGATSQFQFKVAGWSKMAPPNLGLGSSDQPMVEDYS